MADNQQRLGATIKSIRIELTIHTINVDPESPGSATGHSGYRVRVETLDGKRSSCMVETLEDALFTARQIADGQFPKTGRKQV